MTRPVKADHPTPHRNPFADATVPAPGDLRPSGDRALRVLLSVAAILVLALLSAELPIAH